MNPSLDKKLLFVKVLPSDITFRLTPYGYSVGFTNESYPFLVKAWLELSILDVKFFRYNEITKFISYIIILGYILCWFYLCIRFFFIHYL